MKEENNPNTTDSTQDEINWTADEWFAKHHADKLTDEFKSWWVGYYGAPSEYYQARPEQDEYWTRCAFALTGWIAARKPNISAQTPRREQASDPIESHE
jgi:hypothetical protein